MADWNRDGRIDLIVGNFQGEVWFLPNQSKDHQLSFGPGQAVFAGAQKIDVKMDAGPLVADWNGDGIPDLLVGAFDGSITFYAGSGRTGVPYLSEGETLVAELPKDRRDAVLRDRSSKTGEWLLPELERPSLRPKLAVYDWNGDGKLDLIVGDAIRMTSPEPVLDDAKQKERDELVKKEKAAAMDIANLSDVIGGRIRKELRAQNPEMDETTLGDMVRERVDVELSKDDRQCELKRRWEEIWEKLRPLKAERSTHGFVWVYLRTSGPN